MILPNDFNWKQNKQILHNWVLETEPKGFNNSWLWNNSFSDRNRINNRYITKRISESLFYGMILYICR